MYSLPPSTLVNRMIPKKVFIEQLGANTRMKDHFTDDIVRVEWLAKLAPDTINVADGKDVHEITVFRTVLKVHDCANDIYSFIDSFMPRHAVFILQWGGKSCLHINFKEKIEGNSLFRIINAYRSAWVNDADLVLNIDGLNMNAIYESLIRQVAGERIINNSNDLRSDIEASVKREALLKEIETLQRKENMEKQPKKKFELHKHITELKKKLI